jgi:hypothetical protein
MTLRSSTHRAIWGIAPARTACLPGQEDFSQVNRGVFNHIYRVSRRISP